MKNLDARKTRFLRRAKESLHSDDILDFTKVEYVNDRTPITIIDKSLRPDGTEYGEFSITPSNFLKGQRHPDKRKLRISASKQLSQEEIIRRFKEKHPDKLLDYSQVEYQGMHIPVKIISHDLRPDGTEYGEFWQQPCVHLRGGNHPNIARDRRKGVFMITDEVFRQRLKQIFPDEPYDYRFTRYNGRKGFAGIICKLHGPFVEKIESLYDGKGCPRCRTLDSSAEEDIYRTLVHTVGSDNVLCHAGDVVDGQEIDFYLPKYKLAIEYNGLHWHSERIGRDVMYHLNKTITCNTKGIHLIHIFEDEYINHRELVKAKLAKYLNTASLTHLTTDHCEIETISEDLAKDFLDRNHIRGYDAAVKYYGAFYGNILIGVESFMNIQSNGGRWLLTRFAEHPDYMVDGLFECMFKAFCLENNVKEVWTLLDCCWDGKDEDQMLHGAGFQLNDYIPPTSRYTDGHRERLTVDMIMNRCDRERYYRIWDCGFMRYVYYQ